MEHQFPDEFWSDNRQSVFMVLGSLWEPPNLSRSDIERLAEHGNPVLFQSGKQLETAISAEPRWEQVRTRTVNHADRQNDDEAYGAAQDTALKLVAALAGDIPEPLRADFEAMSETIALVTAEHFVQVDLCAEYMVEECYRHDIRNAVILCDPRSVHTALGLKGALTEYGLVGKVAVSPDEGTALTPPAMLKRLWGRLRRAPLISMENAALFSPQLRNAGNREPVKQNVRAFTERLAGCDALLFVADQDWNYGVNALALLREAHDMLFCVASFRGRFDKPLAERFEVGRHRSFEMHPLLRLGLSAKEHAALESITSDFLRPATSLAKKSGLRGRDEIYLRSVAKPLVNNLFNGLGWHRTFRKILAASDLRAVVLSPSRSLPARALTMAARAEGIPTFDMPTGTLTYSRRQWRPAADFVFAADRVTQDIYRSFFNLSDDRVLMVGSPKLDASVHKARTAVSAPLQDGDVFLALQHLKPTINAALISMTAQAMVQAARSRLTIGFHPRENDSNRRHLLGLLEGLPVQTKVCEGDTLMSIARHEICVTYFSFIGLEAFALGVRVIAVNPTDNPWPTRLSEMGIAEEAETTEALTALLNSARRPAVDDDLELLRDGRSASRILKHLAAPPTTSL